MPKTKGTATEFVINLLAAHPDYEMSIDDLYEESGRRFTKGNISNSLARLLEKGRVQRVTDPDRSAWWSIAADPLSPAPSRPRTPEE